MIRTDQTGSARYDYFNDDVPGWRLIFVDTSAAGDDEGNWPRGIAPRVSWLADTLRGTPGRSKVLLTHHSRLSCGNHGDQDRLQKLWESLFDGPQERPLVSLTLGGRLNVAKIRLRDQIGTSLNGNHTFTRFNPTAGVTYKVTPDISVYAGYAEANRAPTPAELSCADPAAPCSLTNFFVGDPPLKQVVARTVEGQGGVGHARISEMTWAVSRARGTGRSPTWTSERGSMPTAS